MIVLAVVIAAAAIGVIVWQIVHPYPAVAKTTRHWNSPNRVRLGLAADADTHAAPSTAAAVGSMLGPAVTGAARSVTNLIDRSSDDELLMHLRQGGVDQHLSSGQRIVRYRLRTLAGLASGAATGGIIGVVLVGQPAFIGLLAVLGAIVGVGLPSTWLLSRIRTRRDLTALQLQPLTHTLAISQMTGMNVDAAIRRLVDAGHGPVVDDLDDALRWRDAGLPLPVALRQLASVTADPHASRCYKALATAADQGADIGEVLLALSEEVRSARRDAVERTAIRRRTILSIPIVLFFLPPLLMMIGAPIWAQMRSL